jgi:putative colanic acid biosynthesis UDP-glucose lipid carrier transferase
MAYNSDSYLLELRENYELLADKNILSEPSLISDKNSKYLTSSVSLSPLLKRRNLIIKRMFDIIFSLAVIIFVLIWLLPLLALLIKLESPGPVFFMQKRNNRDGGRFNCIKLRTMLVNGEAHSVAAVKNDRRVTKLGRLMRFIHLDELPQFINVLMGDMSVIGPRPHMINENVKFKMILSFYDERHMVKPGITGLAQSYGYHGTISGSLHLNKKTAYDLFYIRHWSLGMDVKILMRTVGMICKKTYRK